MNKKALFSFLILTPLFFLVTHAIVFFAHEYGHSFSAWIFGFKENPFGIYYGDTSWQNLLFFTRMHENVDYASFSSQHPWMASFVAFAGSGISNVLLFILSIFALRTKKERNYIYYYFFLWLAVMNLGNFITYVPGRAFATRDDMQYIVSFLNISPWWIMIILGYPVCYAFWLFYSRILPYTYTKLPFGKISQLILLTLVTFTLFVLYGAVGKNGYGDESHLIALLSIYAAPVVIVACWPWRRWIAKKCEEMSRTLDTQEII